MKSFVAALLIASVAAADTDAGYVDVELYDAGTILLEPMACMPPGDSQKLDTWVRTAEGDRDGYKSALVVMTTAAFVVTVAAGVLAYAYVTKK